MKLPALLLILTASLFAQYPYTDIPNYTGTNAGLQFRNAVNTKLNYVNTQLASQGTLIALKEATANKGAANGYAGLDSGAKVPAANLPAAGLNGVLKYTSGVPTAIGTSSTNCIHEDGSSGSCGGSPTYTYTVSFDGGGIPILSSATRCLAIPVSGTLQAVRLQACNGYDANLACNAAGSATIDIKTSTNASYASTGPSATSSIRGSGSTLSISSAYAADGVLTGWTTSTFGGKTVCVALTSPTATLVDVIMTVQ